MRTHSLVLVAALGGCGQMYKSPGGGKQAEPVAAAQPGAAPSPAGGPPGGGDPWTPGAPEPTNTPAMPPEAPREAPPARVPTKAPAAPAGDAERLVAAHNKVRAQHCAQPLTWSPKLAQFAQQWANSLRDQGCKFGHSGGKYGENLAAGTTGAMDPESVVAMWYDEVKGYSFKQPGFSMQTGHFTQVVWRGTTQVGCAMVQCKGNDVWVCEYDPPGNWEGKYREQVLPQGCK